MLWSFFSIISAFAGFNVFKNLIEALRCSKYIKLNMISHHVTPVKCYLPFWRGSVVVIFNSHLHAFSWLWTFNTKIMISFADENSPGTLMNVASGVFLSLERWIMWQFIEVWHTHIHFFQLSPASHSSISDWCIFLLIYSVNVMSAQACTWIHFDWFVVSFARTWF